MNAAQKGLKFAAELLLVLAEHRDDPGDPETRALRYAAGQLNHLTRNEGLMPRGTHGASITLRNTGNEGFASVSERDDGRVVVEIEVSPEHANRVTVTLNGGTVLGQLAEAERT